MALGRTVSCSQKTISALQQSCKDSEYDKTYSYSSPFYFICLCLSHVGKVSVADTRAPALGMGTQTQIFFYLAGSMKINMKIKNGSAQTFLAIWIQPLPGAHLHFAATAFTFCGNPHLLLLAALQTHSQQLHSNNNEQKTSTLNVERTDTV